jgi:hypothetical protein
MEDFGACLGIPCFMGPHNMLLQGGGLVRIRGDHVVSLDESNA